MLLRVQLTVADVPLRERLQSVLVQQDVVVDTPRGKSSQWKRAISQTCDVILAGQSDVPEPVEDNIRSVKNLPESPLLVIVADLPDPEREMRLLAAGCDAILHEQATDDSLEDAINAIFEKRARQLRLQIGRRRAIAAPQLDDFVSESAVMQTFMETVHRVVASDSSLLILGETGVGKERLARAIHAGGPRSKEPFIAVNCGALPESLLESELFGHESGAFTGATRDRRGAFELSHRGIIFLDEIAEMPLHLQVKLLRALQEHEIQRVGGEKTINVDVRIIAASNRDVEEEVRANRFRKDLYYRLSVVTLTLPPLRERREDIPVLVESYINHLRPRISRDVSGIESQALASLERYAWPGNIRELMNVIKRAMLLCDGEEIAPKDLPAMIAQAGQGNPVASAASAFVYADGIPDEMLTKPLPDVRQTLVEDFERAYLSALLRETRGRIGETAGRAGIETRSLYEKMKRYGLRKEDFRK